MTATRDFLRRSPLQHELATPGATFEALADAAIAAHIGGEPPPAAELVIVDLSPVPRVGFKGWNVWARLAALGVAVPDTNNAAAVQAYGGLCLRLGDGEAMLLADPHSPNLHPDGIEAIADDDGFYRVPRRDTHAWIALVGPAVPSMLARMCAVDLRPAKFAACSIAQTTVARIGAVVVRWDRGGSSAYHLLADSMSARYLWKSLGDVSAELGGRHAGLDVLRRSWSDSQHTGGLDAGRRR